MVSLSQRWYPMSGFTSHLLPTERDVWSDAAGDPSRAPEQHGLPSAAWEWEDPWMPECNPRLADKQVRIKKFLSLHITMELAVRSYKGLDVRRKFQSSIQ